MPRQRKRRGRGPALGEWKYTVGEIPYELTAYERTDTNYSIYTRIWNGRRIVGRRALCQSIRDESGRIVPDLEVMAQQLAITRQREAQMVVEEEQEVPGGPLTVAGGFRLLLHRREGKYPVDTPHRREVERAARLVQDVVGKDTLWEQLRHRDYRKVWRHMAHKHVEKKGKVYGLRSAEIVCGVLQSASRWLQQEGRIEPGDALPAPGWKQVLRTEWETITNAPLPVIDRPRYTDREARALWKALPLADPRVALAAELGAELRLGQVLRIRRSDILPSPYGRWQIGMLRVHGRGKKRVLDIECGIFHFSG